MTWFVYRNITRKIWSLRRDPARRVMGHSPAAHLIDCTFYVSQAGRARVLATQRKNVHAGIKARFLHTGMPVTWPWPEAVEITYNPYKYETFVRKDTGEPVFSARTVVLDEGGRAWMVA